MHLTSSGYLFFYMWTVSDFVTISLKAWNLVFSFSYCIFN